MSKTKRKLSNKRSNKITFKERIKITEKVYDYCRITNNPFTVDDVRRYVDYKLNWTFHLRRYLHNNEEQ